MKDTTSLPASYELVLRDLRAKRDNLTRTIETIESLLDPRTGQIGDAVPSPADASPPSSGTSSKDVDRGPTTAAPSEAKPLYGLTIPEASIAVLSAHGKPLPNVALVEELKRGGLALAAIDPVNTVGSVLTRRFHSAGDIVRISRGLWGLPQWYPDRDFAREVADKQARRKKSA
ncbi:hypothetical protein [Methylobacterium sp.]|uniref:hypothetical protein n=1 Tax=Methylobacterium sp. TaxID=409 RepID=UPI00257D0736|nr:hypothetical protein [Methylobacterium sp.]